MNRKLALATVAVVSLALVSACGQKADGTTDLNPGQSEPVNAAQDATSTAVGAAAAPMAATTTEGFVTAAAISDMYEIQAANIALKSAKNAEVKKFAQQMITDHTKSSNAIKPLAQAAGVALPVEMDQRRKGLIDNLNAAGDRFDEIYIDQQVAAHTEASALFHGYADGGADAGLKAFAAATVQAIDHHLEMIRAMDAAGEGAGGAPPARN